MNADTLPRLAPSAARDGQRRTILIIDDDKSQVAALAHRLESQGYQTLVAHEGLHGFGLAQSERPDLVLLDLCLPDVDGLQVCERLADSPETCGIPIIILSGVERPDIVRRSRAAGCTYFVRKPYDPNALLTLIQHSLTESSSCDW
jgi:two-component system cell cycle response regulator